MMVDATFLISFILSFVIIDAQLFTGELIFLVAPPIAVSIRLAAVCDNCFYIYFSIIPMRNCVVYLLNYLNLLLSCCVNTTSHRSHAALDTVTRCQLQRQTARHKINAQYQVLIYYHGTILFRLSLIRTNNARCLVVCPVDTVEIGQLRLGSEISLPTIEMGRIT